MQPSSLSRLRVLHLADMINRHDFIYNILAHCRPDRVEQFAATLTTRGTVNANPGKLQVASLEGTSRLALPRTIHRLRRLLKRRDVAVVHSHHYEPALIAAIATLGLPTRLVIGRHYSDTIYTFSTGVRRRVYLGLEGFCNRRAVAVVAPSTVVEQILLRQGVPSSKVAKIHYGLDLARFARPDLEKRQRLRLEWPAGDGLRIATVGRLHAEKGQEYLLRALGLLQRRGLAVRLLLLGDGQDRPRLAAIAAAEGVLDSVRFIGWRDDALEVMSAADAVVQPTLNEAFSQVMIESMALGCALVMTDVGGVRDVIEDGVSGLVVPVRNAPALAGAIQSLQAPGTVERIGANAARVARERLDVTRIARQFETLYLSVGHGLEARLVS